MNKNITLTLATEKDAELIHLMKYEAFLPLYEIYRDDEISPVKEPLEKVIAILERKASEYYIIKADGLPVGAIRVCHRKRDYEPPAGEVPAYISPLFILPRFQNRGIAQIAVKMVFDLYPEATVWRLDTIKQEEGNCHFYEKLGFVKTGVEHIVNERMTLIDYEKKMK